MIAYFQGQYHIPEDAVAHIEFDKVVKWIIYCLNVKVKTINDEIKESNNLNYQVVKGQ
jgi:hypothetical protein